jgi:hypothetical protein
VTNKSTPRTGNLILPPNTDSNSSNRSKEKRGGALCAAPKKAGTRAYLILIALVLAAFSPLLSPNVVWSEHDTVQRSDYELIDHWQEAWSLSSIRGSDPISLTTYFLEQAIPLPEGVAHRGINILLHLFAAILLLKNLEALKLPGAFAATLVFALHPTAVQTLYWAGYRTELVGLILILCALYFGIRNRTTFDYIYTILLTLIASLIHPAALGIPFILVLSILYTSKKHSLDKYNRVLPLFCVCLFIGIWVHGADNGVASELGTIEKINLAGKNMSFFTKQALIPVKLALFYPIEKGSSYSIGAQMSLLPFFLFIPFYLLIICNIKKKWSHALLLGLTGYLILVIHGVSQPARFIDGSSAQEDHGQYVALPIILTLIVAGSGTIIRKLEPGGKILAATAFAGLIFIEIMLTASFTYAISNPTKMWQSINAQWPNSWQAKVAYIESTQHADEPQITNDELIMTISAILADKPDQIEMRRLRLRAYVAEGQSNNALREYKRILRETKADNAFLEEAARLYEKLGLDWDAAKVRQRMQP